MVEADTSEVPPEDTEADPGAADSQAGEVVNFKGHLWQADLERQRLRRQKSRKLLYIFGWTQVVEGAVACVLGIATIVFSSPTLTFTFLMGTQMWCGIILLSAGFLGVRASKYQDLPDGRINRREKSIIMMYYSWTIIAFLPAVLILLYAGVAVALCNRDAPADTATACFALDNIQTGLGLTNVTVGTVLSLTIIPFLAFIGVFCKSYAAKSKARRARTSVTSAGGTVLEDAVRRQSHIIRQQQEQIQLLSQRQQAMEQRIRASHVPLEAPPPYRQDAPPGVEFPKSPPGVEFPKTPPPYKHIQQSDQTVAAS